MKMRDLRDMSDDQLQETLDATTKEFFQLRFQAATERLDAPSELRRLRKDIARIKTLQRQREIAGVMVAG